jgi:hypothetical protein
MKEQVLYHLLTKIKAYNRTNEAGTSNKWRDLIYIIKFMKCNLDYEMNHPISLTLSETFSFSVLID